MDSSYCGSLRRYDVTRKRRLPPRIVLRPLASYKFIFYLLVSYIFLQFLWQKSFISSTLLLVVLYLLSLVAKALVNCISGDNENQGTKDIFTNPIDLTLDATTLSQDDSF